MEATAYLNTTDLSPTHAISDQDRTHHIGGHRHLRAPVRTQQHYGGVVRTASWVSWSPAGRCRVSTNGRAAPLWALATCRFSGLPGHRAARGPAQHRTARLIRTPASNAARRITSCTTSQRSRSASPGLRGVGLNMIDLSTSKNMRLDRVGHHAVQHKNSSTP